MSKSRQHCNNKSTSIITKGVAHHGLQRNCSVNCQNLTNYQTASSTFSLYRYMHHCTELTQTSVWTFPYSMFSSRKVFYDIMDKQEKYEGPWRTATSPAVTFESFHCQAFMLGIRRKTIQLSNDSVDYKNFFFLIALNSLHIIAYNSNRYKNLKTYFHYFPQL